ncbi:carbon starvation protein A, partial [candidate division KSB1 bacterium]|nr:carbon starvation protein A [candidate division KSB1 bacterium]
MNAALVAVIALGAFFLAYFTYAKFIARRIFALDPDAKTPAHTMTDGIDYVPTKKPVLFGHHFASITGLGPILGPAIAVIWGWFPAFLWVFFGTIFFGGI